MAPWNSHTGTPCRPEAGLRMPPAATGATAAKQPVVPASWSGLGCGCGCGFG